MASARLKYVCVGHDRGEKIYISESSELSRRKRQTQRLYCSLKILDPIVGIVSLNKLILIRNSEIELNQLCKIAINNKFSFLQ